MQIMVTSVEKAKSKTGSEYLRVRYTSKEKVDRTAVIFDLFPDEATLVGSVCEVTLKEGQPSDKIEGISIVEGADVSEFIRVTEHNVDQMIEDLKAMTRGPSCDPVLTNIVDTVLFNVPKRVERFQAWPAGHSMHHSFKGGLLEHTWGMMKLAKAVFDTDPAMQGAHWYTIACALVLHDVGKMLCYNFSNAGVIEKTNLDLLLGHISLADELVVKACSAQTPPVSTTSGIVLNLRHCILSHHGKKEWGSPVIPATREAIFLHQVDMMQVRNEMAKESLKTIEVGKRSPYTKALDTELVRT